MKNLIISVLSLLISFSVYTSPKQTCQKFLEYKKKQTTKVISAVIFLKHYKTLCYFEENKLLFWAKGSYGRKEGKKRFRGDLKTPEGNYFLYPARKSKKYGLFMLISYPNSKDFAFAKTHGKVPGGSVGVHGPQKWYSFLGSMQSLVNHSEGCIVLDEKSIIKLSSLIKRKVKITIYPVDFIPF